MKKLMLHIGAGKCGSSTIQNQLGTHFTSAEGVTNSEGDVLHYAAVLEDGTILKGPDLRIEQEKAAAKYVASASFPSDPDLILGILHRLRESVGVDDTVILSNEGWASAITPEVATAFDRLGVPIDVLFITRPPVDWMNASWWQWGAWTDHTLEQWIEAQIGAVDFFSIYEKWRALEAVQKIHVVDLSQNIIAALHNFLKTDAVDFDAGPRLNVATNFNLLRHLINNKDDYGRTDHNPVIEFELNNILSLSEYRPPFVIPAESSKWIMSSLRAENEKLVDLFRQSELPFDEDKAKWYLDPDSYSEREVIDVKAALCPDENDAFIGELVKAVLQRNVMVLQSDANEVILGLK